MMAPGGVLNRSVEFAGMWRDQFRSQESLRRLQERRLQRALRDACERVPFWRSRFDAAGVGPNDVRTLDDLGRISITEKEDLFAAGEEALLSRGVIHVRRRYTSGSTGQPLPVRFSANDTRRRQLVELRSLLRVGLRFRDRLVILGPTEPITRGLLQRLGVLRADRVSGLLPVEQQVSRLRELDPTILWAYPSLFKVLIAHLGGSLAPACRPRALISSAELVDPQLGNAAGQPGQPLPTFNFYGAVELGRLAWECPAHQGLHVNVDQFILELVPPRLGRLADDPALGEAVVTMLNADAMPLIRYRLGDLCRWLEGDCPCGCTFPRIAAPVGRYNEVVHLPSGRILSPFGFNAVLRGADAFAHFRIIQDRVDAIRIEYVARRPPGADELADLEARLAAYLGETVRFDFLAVPRMDLHNLKLRYFENRLASSGTGPS